jgi:hypothetical protein
MRWNSSRILHGELTDFVRWDTRGVERSIPSSFAASVGDGDNVSGERDALFGSLVSLEVSGSVPADAGAAGAKVSSVALWASAAANLWYG